MGGLLLRNCSLVVKRRGIVEEEVDVLIEDGRIVAVDKGLGGGSDELDCRGLIVMPGLVNAHTHAAMWAFRGLFDRGELHEWLSAVWRVEPKLTWRLVYEASRAAVAEMLMNGVTAFVDMYFHVDATLKAAEELGVRAYTGPTLVGGLDEGKIRRAEEELASITRRATLGGAVVNVHAPYTSSVEVYREAARLAERYGVLLSTHVSETRDEVYEVKRRYGVFPVELLSRIGFLGPRSSLVHLGWVTSWELEEIRRSGATVVHCPSSNMKLATGGFLPLREMLDSGINVALGTDGPVSNNTLDMFREMRMAVLLARNNYWRTDVDAWGALEMATVNGYRMIGLKGGVVEPGAAADLALLNASSPRLAPLTARRAVSHIVYSACGCDVAYTVVGGSVVYGPEKRGALVDTIREAGAVLSEVFG